MKFFCDTYAMVEIIKGNRSYQPYLEQELHTNILNLYELFYILLKGYDEITAKEYFYEFASFILPIEDHYLFAAASFKLKFQKKNISYADALGYAMAENKNMRFLTGDKEFKDMDNVEFVK
ncbi:MAG TPA: PIN domain-containing protein [Candidatus Nanoarchaeia archaeon]|nr:PIN domain-containing protein [Candidatus Nanoarchaeia archaeon]